MSYLPALLLLTSTFPAFARTCEDLAKLPLEHVTLTTVETVKSGSFTPPGGKPIEGLPPFCRVAATIRPVPDSEIRVEVWLPLSGWNERIEGTGNGGLAGSIGYGSLAGGVRSRYAVANTDMGMATPDATAFIDRPERWKDWGYRSTHEMTVLTKQLVAAFYEKDPKKSYFYGCSTGGEQALMEAQRFPDDYDGIVGGAPANNRTGVHQSILWTFAEPQKSAAAYLPLPKLELLAGAVMQACDALDGLKDGLIADPLSCHFDPAVLTCKAGDAADCLTAPQVVTAKAIYTGPVNARTGESIYPGLEPGSELKWDTQTATPGSTKQAPFFPVFAWVFGRTWNWRGFDFDHDVSTMDQKLAGMVNATSPDLDTFHAHGHKLLVYHGWNDPLVAPGESVRYHDSVVARAGSGNPDDFYQLFMVPGMEHCGGGPGPSGIDPLGTMVRWVEDGVAPHMIATRRATPEGAPAHVQERLLCPYPQVARYTGKGDADAAVSFTCTK